MPNNEPLLRTLLIIIAIVLLIPFLMMIVAWPMMGMWGGSHMWNGTAGASWLWLLMRLIPLLAVLGVGYLLYKAILRTNDQAKDTALEELRLAYARGDLSSEEFEERLDRLKRRE